MFFSISSYPVIYYFGVRPLLIYGFLSSPWKLWKLYKLRHNLGPLAATAANQYRIWRAYVALILAPVVIAWTCYWCVEKDVFYKTPAWPFIPLCLAAVVSCFVARQNRLTSKVSASLIWRATTILVFVVAVSAFVPWGLPLYVYELVFSETLKVSSSVHWLLTPLLATASYMIGCGARTLASTPASKETAAGPIMEEPPTP